MIYDAPTTYGEILTDMDARRVRVRVVRICANIHLTREGMMLVLRSRRKQQTKRKDEKGRRDRVLVLRTGYGEGKRERGKEEKREGGGAEGRVGQI